MNRLQIGIIFTIVMVSQPVYSEPKACLPKSSISNLKEVKDQSELLLNQTSAPITEKDLIEKGYFNSLDYSHPESAAKIPEFESELISIATTEMKSDHPNPLVLSYAAMYLVNTDDAVTQGKLSYSDITKLHRFSEANDLTSEMKARNEQIYAWLNKASELSPNDTRIQSWKLGQEIRMKGGLGLDKMLIQAEKSSSVFELISAIIVSNDYPLNSTQKDLVFRLVQKMISKDRPCKSKEEAKTPACKGSSLAPFSRQSSVAILVDQLLKKAADTHNQNPSQAITGMIMDYSLSISSFPSTLKWPGKKVLSDQIKTAHLVLGKKAGMDDPYFSSDHTKGIYQCASCHQGGALK